MAPGVASKVLLVFCDGTGQDGILSSDARARLAAQGNADVLFQTPGTDATATEPRGGSSNQQFATNVLRLSRAVLPVSASGKEQIVLYQSGVGSEADFQGQGVTGTGPMLALGTSVASKIRDVYAFIAQNFEDGDEICIFGFSRGAYTARKVAGLIDAIGLLQRESLGRFFNIWRQLVDGKKPTIPAGTRTTRIKCVGVWDTVGSVYNTIDALSIKDTSLPASVDVALHALSLQENRQKFLPTLWTVPAGGLRAGQVLKQIWFAGAHSDVGGGYERHELADLALFWMAGEIKNLVALDLQFLQRSGQPNPEPWGTSQPHNAYEDLSILEKPIIGHETRLESKQITKDSVLHESIRYAPTKLQDSDYMVTLPILQRVFGGGWPASFPPLNEFEQTCKNQWGKQPRSNHTPIEFERPGDLFGN